MSNESKTPEKTAAQAEHSELSEKQLEEAAGGVSKSMDRTSMDLAQYAINGNSPRPAEINFVEVAGGSDTD